MGECTKLRGLLDAMVEWSQSLKIQKIEIIPRNLKHVKSSPKDANMLSNWDS